MTTTLSDQHPIRRLLADALAGHEITRGDLAELDAYDGSLPAGTSGGLGRHRRAVLDAGRTIRGHLAAGENRAARDAADDAADEIGAASTAAECAVTVSTSGEASLDDLAVRMFS